MKNKKRYKNVKKRDKNKKRKKRFLHLCDEELCKTPEPTEMPFEMWITWAQESCRAILRACQLANTVKWWRCRLLLPLILQPI